MSGMSALPAPPRSNPVTLFIRGHGVTRADVARHLGISTAMVSAYFDGTAVAPPTLLDSFRALLKDEGLAQRAFGMCPRTTPGPPRHSPFAQALKARGITYATVAASLGVSPATVGLWATGKVAAPRRFEDLARQLLGDDVDAALAPVRWQRRERASRPFGRGPGAEPPAAPPFFADAIRTYFRPGEAEEIIGRVPRWESGRPPHLSPAQGRSGPVTT